MPVRIRLARFGRKNLPFYRIFVADSRSPRDGKHIEIVGHYDPVPAKDGTKHVGLKLDRIRHWLSRGAQPSKPVASLLHRAGVAPAPPRAQPKATGVRNPDKRPAKTAASFAAAGLEGPKAAGSSA